MSPKNTTGTETLSVQIESELHDQLKAAAYWTRETKRAVVETALRNYLDLLHRTGTLEPIPDGAQLSRGRRPAIAGDSAESRPT